MRRRGQSCNSSITQMVKPITPLDGVSLAFGHSTIDCPPIDGAEGRRPTTDDRLLLSGGPHLRGQRANVGKFLTEIALFFASMAINLTHIPHPAVPAGRSLIARGYLAICREACSNRGSAGLQAREFGAFRIGALAPVPSWRAFMRWLVVIFVR